VHNRCRVSDVPALMPYLLWRLNDDLWYTSMLLYPPPSRPVGQPGKTRSSLSPHARRGLYTSMLRLDPPAVICLCRPCCYLFHDFLGVGKGRSLAVGREKQTWTLLARRVQDRFSAGQPSATSRPLQVQGTPHDKFLFLFFFPSPLT
jgi:hypothetical protein